MNRRRKITPKLNSEDFDKRCRATSKTALLFFRVKNTHLNEHVETCLINLKEKNMMNEWYNKEEDIRAHEGERDEKIKATEAQETGRYNEWD